VMALAGAPVRAHSLTLSPLTIGATLNVHDAIHDGVSRFYAEIKRIRMLMDMAHGPTPLLFLFDEIFHGTNSCDRRAGAHAVLRGLLENGAIGITTTHDLAITELAQQFHGIAVNVHFEDHLEQDRLVFDYKLRPGIVEKSNALDLMRAIGLRVD
jgi:DNA mismatch repair ATPase MutS